MGWTRAANRTVAPARVRVAARRGDGRCDALFGYPPAAVSQAAAPRASRSARSDWSAIALAVLIGFASIFSALVAWRASLAAIDSSRLQSLAVQEQARQQQLERLLEGVVAEDERLLAVYQEHALAARELQAQADALRGNDPEAADRLDLEAHARLALARAIQPFFQGASGIYLDDAGAVVYDRAFVLRNLQAGNIELRELRPAETQVLAQQADLRTMALLGVAAVIVLALFFLTVAQVTKRRRYVRYGFVAVGAALVVGSMLGLLLVELPLL